MQDAAWPRSSTFGAAPLAPPFRAECSIHPSAWKVGVLGSPFGKVRPGSRCALLCIFPLHGVNHLLRLRQELLEVYGKRIHGYGNPLASYIFQDDEAHFFFLVGHPGDLGSYHEKPKAIVPALRGGHVVGDNRVELHALNPSYGSRLRLLGFQIWVSL